VQRFDPRRRERQETFVTKHLLRISSRLAVLRTAVNEHLLHKVPSWNSTESGQAILQPGAGNFNPSMQRHYRSLILLLILLYVSVVRPSSGRNILSARFTQMTMDPLFLEYS
jgi:hypothetical protein